MIFHHMFSNVMFCVNLCSLNKHTGSISIVSDFFFPQYHRPCPSCSNNCVSRGRWHSLLSHCMCIYLFFLPFAYEVVCKRSLSLCERRERERERERYCLVSVLFICQI